MKKKKLNIFSHSLCCISLLSAAGFISSGQVSQAASISLTNGSGTGGALDGTSAIRNISVGAGALGSETIVTDVNVTISFSVQDDPTSTSGFFGSTPDGDGFSSPNDAMFQLTSAEGTVINLVEFGTFSPTFAGTGGTVSATITFDDAASILVGGSLAGGTYDRRSVDSLSAFNGENALGLWSLQIADLPPPDGDILREFYWTLDLETTGVGVPEVSSTFTLMGIGISFMILIARFGFRKR